MLATRRGRVPPRHDRGFRRSRDGDRVILPRENEQDLDELPAETREAVRFVLVDSIDEVFEAAFGSNGSRANGRVRPTSAER
jgi:predicted ATP-dependent protease